MDGLMPEARNAIRSAEHLKYLDWLGASAPFWSEEIQFDRVKGKMMSEEQTMSLLAKVSRINEKLCAAREHVDALTGSIPEKGGVGVEPASLLHQLSMELDAVERQASYLMTRLSEALRVVGDGHC